MKCGVCGGELKTASTDLPFKINEDEQIDTTGGTIDVIPVWRFLLDMSELAD
jgi:hypothetical protein